MDKLANDAKLARQAGMSYGQWKAAQQPAKVEKKIPDGWLVCEQCGKPFKPKTKRPQKFCEFTCQRQASKERDRQKNTERMREWRAQKKAEG